MKKSRLTDSQIIGVLKQAEAGIPVPQLCRTRGISTATFYKWHSKFGGMDVPMMSRVKELEEENRHLKKMYAEVQMRAGRLQQRRALRLAALVDHVGAPDDQRVEPADGLDVLAGIRQHVEHVAHRVQPRTLLAV